MTALQRSNSVVPRLLWSISEYQLPRNANKIFDGFPFFYGTIRTAKRADKQIFLFNLNGDRFVEAWRMLSARMDGVNLAVAMGDRMNCLHPRFPFATFFIPHESIAAECGPAAHLAYDKISLEFYFPSANKRQSGKSKPNIINWIIHKKTDIVDWGWGWKGRVGVDEIRN